jgi:RNA polymerase sigma-70 factor, ECF subfamily
VSTDIERRIRFEAVAGEVYEPLQRYLRRRAPIDDAEEAFGDALLTIWRRIDDVPCEAVLPWCYGVAKRALANRRRATGRRLRLADRLAAEPPSPHAGDPSDCVEFADIQAALEHLDDADREVLELWAWEELEPREIAAVLDTTANAISLRLQRAKRRLANEMERQSAASSGHNRDETAKERRQ